MATDQRDKVVAWWATSADGMLHPLEHTLFRSAVDVVSAGSRFESSLALAVADEGLVALMADLTHALGLHTIESDAVAAEPSVPPVADLRPWSGALRAHVVWDEANCAGLLIHLHADAVPRQPARSHQATPVPRRPLNRLSVVLAQQQMPLCVMLDATTVTLADLLSLQPGDVILTPHALTKPMQVLAPRETGRRTDMPLYAGHLGEQQGRRALSLLASPPSSAQPDTQTRRAP